MGEIADDIIDRLLAGPLWGGWDDFEVDYGQSVERRIPQRPVPLAEERVTNMFEVVRDPLL